MGDLGLIPGLERSPGEENSYPFQYSGLENPMDYPWSHKESDMTKQLSLHMTVLKTYNQALKREESVIRYQK